MGTWNVGHGIEIVTVAKRLLLAKAPGKQVRFVLAATLLGWWIDSGLACGGPMAYYGGRRLGALHLGGDTALSLLAIGVEWALVTPAFVYLSEVGSLDGLKR